MFIFVFLLHGMSNDLKIDCKKNRQVYDFGSEYVWRDEEHFVGRDLIDRSLKYISTLWCAISSQYPTSNIQHMLKSSWAAVSVLACNICSIKFNTHNSPGSPGRSHTHTVLALNEWTAKATADKRINEWTNEMDEWATIPFKHSTHGMWSLSKQLQNRVYNMAYNNYSHDG